MGIAGAFPIESPASFNAMVVAGSEITPGACIVSKADRKYKWDVKDPEGSQGATYTYRGWKVAKPEVKFLFWADEQIDDFNTRIVPLFAYDATKTDPKPVDVYHPYLGENDIYTVIVDEIGQLTSEGAGLYSRTVMMTEYRVVKKQNVTSSPKAALPLAAMGKTLGNVIEQEAEEAGKLFDQFKNTGIGSILFG